MNGGPKMRKNMASLLLVVLSLCSARAFAAPAVVIDDFEDQMANKIGGRFNAYMQAPSKSLAIKSEGAHGGTKALMVKYDKKGKGGPYDSGGWCGYYTLVKSGPRYFDATPYQSLTFWVKGGSGNENFMVGLADKHWDEVGDSVKSEEIGKYIPSGKLTTEWQKATIPLSTFMLEKKELASIAVCFEGSLFPDGAGTGTVYVDDMAFE